MNNITIESLKTNYLNALQAQNSKINAFAPNTFWSLNAGPMSAVLLDLYMNLQLVKNSIYLQNSVGDQVDQALYAEGLPARGGLTYGTITCTVESTTPITIPINTIFTDIGNLTNVPPIIANGNQFQTLQAITVSDNNQLITLYAVNPGSNILETAGTKLKNDGLDCTLIVQICTNGQTEESDQSCITRGLQAKRTPQAGAREEDYFNFARLASQQVTWAIIIPAYVTINQVGKLGVIPLVGTVITEYQLNQGLLPSTTFVGYSRQADTSVLNTVTAYIQSERLVGLPVSVVTNVTDIIDPFTINVSLVPGYSLNTLLNIESQDSSNKPITIQLSVKQLIQREVRRGICNQAYGATNINNQNYITIDSLLNTLNQQLFVNSGQLAQILINTSFSIDDIAVPNFNASDISLFYTYDIASYNSITVIQL